jgi:hypothetical protein
MITALGATIWVFVYNSTFAGKKLIPYLVVPVALTWTQFLGEAIQRHGLGPSLMRNSLQDFGLVANFGVGLTPFYILFWWKCTRKDAPTSSIAASQLMRVLPWGCALMLVICVVTEVGLTLHRETMKAKGYSGQLDIPDLIAYVLGFIAILVNHKVMRPRIVRSLEITTS